MKEEEKKLFKIVKIVYLHTSPTWCQRQKTCTPLSGNIILTNFYN